MLKKFFLNNNYFFIFAVIIFSFGVNFYYSNIGVMPMDNFVLYNGGYRVLNGYIPFKDYWLVTGPLLDYLNGFFFLILGTSWKSFIIHSSIFNSLIAVSTYFIFLEFKLNKLISFLYTSSFSLLMYPVAGAPFVDHHSTIFVILAFYLLILGIKNNNFFSWFLIPFLICLSFLSKQTPSSYALIVIFILIVAYIVLNPKKLKSVFFPLLYGAIFALSLLICFFYFTEIPFNNFWMQYVLYAKSIGDQRFYNMVLSFKSVFLQYKYIYVPLIFLVLYLFILLKNFKKNKENFLVIISIIGLSLLLIFHQMVTLNQIYIFFLIPLLTAFVHVFFVPILNKNKILLYLIIAICVFSVSKYHYRFNEERKFNELQNVDLKKSIDAEAIHSSLAGLKWITMNYPNNPKAEIEALKESMNILQNDQRKKSLITAYQFIAPALLIYDFSPNQWHHPTVSFPIRGQKYFEIYKSFFINNIKRNNIDVVYSIGKVEKEILGLILANNCFKTEKKGKIIFSHTIFKNCEDFQ
tara:strand:+ start:1791 stop:3356 length:1566 start_codon:yes stop_codon:yes gene_type:complete